jgi:hypothetical protein
MAKGSPEAAETRQAKAQVKAREAAQVMSEVQAEARRVENNTARLRALRLARDAQVAAEAAANPPKAKKSAASKKTIPVDKLNARNDG